MSDLAHSGVKGMRWGQHKVVEPTHPTYTKGMQANDRNAYGDNGVTRINSRLNAGQTRAEAQQKEHIRSVRKKLAIAGGLLAVSILVEHGPTHLSNLEGFVAGRANANRAAAKSAESTLAIGSKAAKLAFAKAHGGVFNITTLK